MFSRLIRHMHDVKDGPIIVALAYKFGVAHAYISPSFGIPGLLFPPT
jgi:hypothetical protein